MLITIRVIAVWIYNRIVMAATIGMCITNIGFLLYGAVMLRSKWSNVSNACTLENPILLRYNMTVTTVTDVAQLIIMLIGLLRSLPKNHRGLLRYVCIQGLIWLIVATIGEIPSAVFINLNLNEPWSTMFQQLAFYTMIICATRMYRALILYDMDVDVYSDGPKVISPMRDGSAGAATTRTDLSFVGTKDSEISLAEKLTHELTPVGDEEV
ncbi:hypothetical protein BJV77DRAFT_621876 [Russula vinacea]|nr:hypothetical protein BJV77DRAFT_621876 [Russula vinacea]